MRCCIQGRGPATKLALALLLAGGFSKSLGAQTGLLVVAHGAGPEWNGRVREIVGQVRWAHGPVATAFLMGAEADSAGWDAGLRRLVHEGATRIVVVPLMVSSHGSHYREIEYYAGLRDSAPDPHAHHVRRPPPVAMRVAPALDSAPELGSALAERWSALGPADRGRSVLLVAHGPNDSADAERWVHHLMVASAALRAAGLEGDLRIGLLRDDAPPEVRAAAVAELRAQAIALAGNDSVVVLPVLISSGEINAQKIPRDLADLAVRYHPAPLAPSAHLARWIERSAAEELESFVAPAATQSHDEHTVIAVVEALAAFSQAKNVAGLDTLYAPDPWVRTIEGAGVNVGWTDYRDHHLTPELAEFQNFRYRYYEIEPQVRGNVAWASFRYELIADTPQGHVEAEGRGTAILEKRGGRWLVVHTHTSGRRRQAR